MYHQVICVASIRCLVIVIYHSILEQFCVYSVMYERSEEANMDRRPVKGGLLFIFLEQQKPYVLVVAQKHPLHIHTTECTISTSKQIDEIHSDSTQIQLKHRQIVYLFPPDRHHVISFSDRSRPRRRDDSLSSHPLQSTRRASPAQRKKCIH